MKCFAGLTSYLGRHELGICSMLAGTSFIAFMTLLPLVIDPNIVTFVLKLEPAWCYTTYSLVLNGTSNCTWTSCQEGCTVDIYKCWHINVSYALNDPEVRFPSFDEDGVPYENQEPARLYPNVVGCGYPPEVNCEEFYRKYGSLDSRFPCFVSIHDPSVAVIHADKTEAALNISLGSIPLVLFFFFVFYVALRIRCKRRRKLIRAQGSKPKATVTVVDENVRRQQESKRILETRKQSWLNTFQKDRVSSSSCSSLTPSSSATKLNLNSARVCNAIDKAAKITNRSAASIKENPPLPITSISGTLPPLTQLMVNT